MMISGLSVQPVAPMAQVAVIIRATGNSTTDLALSGLNFLSTITA